MELQLSSSLLFFIVTFFFIVIIFNRFRANKNLPPQPWKLPLLGHMHHLLGAPPHRALENLANKLGPILRLQLGEISAVLISSPHLAKEIMNTHDLSFANRPKLLCIEIVGYNYTSIAFSPYGDYWRQMRKICILELLSAKKVKSFRCIRDEESLKLIKATTTQRSNAINLSEMIFMMMNTIISRIVVGSTCKDQGTLLALIEEATNLASGFDVADLYPSIKILHLITGMSNKLMKIRNKMDVILDSIISEPQERRAGGQITHENEDLLDVLLRLKYDSGLEFPITYDNIKAVLLVSAIHLLISTKIISIFIPTKTS